MDYDYRKQHKQSNRKQPKHFQNKGNNVIG